MDTRQIAKQMIFFNKSAFDNNFNSLQALQEQTEKIINKFWDKTPLFPDEGRIAISEWIRAYKKGAEDYKKIEDENFKKVEDFFSEGS